MNKQLLVLLLTPAIGHLYAQSDHAQNHPGHVAYGTEYAHQHAPVLLDSDLPVLDLVSFTATSTGSEGVLVVFATVSERPIEHFTIQRSRDLMNWNTVAAFPGQGSTDAYTSYEVLDHSPINGVSYYRLVQEDGDIVEELSDLFSVRHEALQDLALLGGHKPGYFTVQANGTLSEVSVMNNRGQFMPMQLDMSGDRLNVNAELWENGTYYIQAMVNGSRVMRSVVISNGSIIGG